MKNFSPKAAFWLADITAHYIDYDDIEEFKEDLMEFLEAYDAPADEEISGDADDDEAKKAIKG